MQIAEDVSDAFVRSNDLEGHHRLEEGRPRPVRGGDERLGAGHLEGVIVGIYRVIAAADNLDAEVGHRVTSEHATLDGLGDPASTAGACSCGISADRRAVLVDVATAPVGRLDDQLDVAVLAAGPPGCRRPGRTGSRPRRGG